METTGIMKIVKNLGGIISKNSPIILTGIAVGGLVTTGIFAGRDTIKAMQIIEEQTGYDHDGNVLSPDIKETIKLTWKCYIPTLCMGAVTIACIIGSTSINQRRNAALATVYGVTEAAFREYKEKVVETIGKNKELRVRDDISSDRIKQNPPNTSEVIFTGKGDFLCYDSLSGRYFKSDIEQIRKIINQINKELMSSMWINLNELYYEFGLPEIKLGDEVGWDIDKGLIDISFSSHVTENGEPCLVLNYDVSPKSIRS